MILASARRSGATVVETAIVLPIAFLFLFGLIIGGLGVHRYHQVAYLAREGARWASVRGLQYQAATSNPAATPEDVFEEAIEPNLMGLNPTLLTYQVTWNPNKRQGSLVTVQVSYQWLPEAYFGGVTLTSTSVMPVSY